MPRARNIKVSKYKWSLYILILILIQLKYSKLLETEGNHGDTPDMLRNTSLNIFHRIISWVKNPSLLGRPKCSGSPPVSVMNVPMILLNLLDELRHAGVIDYVSRGMDYASFDRSKTLSLSTDNADIDYAQAEQYCIQEILKHVRTDRKIVLETVLDDGTLLDSYDGRHMNPGHAIEAGWFLLTYAQRTNDNELMDVARDMIEWSFEIGWDKQYEGLFYFLDSEGHSPPYLEWNMKLCELLILCYFSFTPKFIVLLAFI